VSKIHALMLKNIDLIHFPVANLKREAYTFNGLLWMEPVQNLGKEMKLSFAAPILNAHQARETPQTRTSPGQ